MGIGAIAASILSGLTSSKAGTASTGSTMPGDGGTSFANQLQTAIQQEQAKRTGLQHRHHGGIQSLLASVSASANSSSASLLANANSIAAAATNAAKSIFA